MSPEWAPYCVDGILHATALGTSEYIDHRCPPLHRPVDSHTQHSHSQPLIAASGCSACAHGSNHTSSQCRAAMASLRQSTQLARVVRAGGGGCSSRAQPGSVQMCDAQGQESQEARVGVRLRAAILRHRARTWSDAAGLSPSHVSRISRGESTPHLPALLGMSPSRLQMVVLPISSDSAGPDDSNTIAPPARWPRSSVLSSSLTS